jgi:pseudouridine kinase
MSTDSTPAPILVIGAANFDIKGRMFKTPLLESSNPAVMRTSFGGVARNIAENLARLGKPTVFMTVVGDDIPGRDMLTSAFDTGINVSRSLKIAGETTGTYLAALDTRGDLYLGLDDIRILRHLTPDYLRKHEEAVRACAMVVFDLNLGDDAIDTLLTLAEKHGKPVCADPTATTITHRLIPFLPRIDVITPNADEAQILLGGFKIHSDASALEAARMLVTRGVKTAVITQDKFGACFAAADDAAQLPAPTVTIADTTGAGDSLTAMLIYGIVEGWPLRQCLRMGMALAAHTLSTTDTVARDIGPVWLQAALARDGV